MMRIKSNLRNWIPAFFLIWFLAAAANAETVHLKSGQVIKGTIVARTEDAIKIDTGVGIPLTYYLDEIESVSAAAPSVPPAEITKEKPLPTPVPVPDTQAQTFQPASTPEPPPHPIQQGPPQELELYQRTTNLPVTTTWPLSKEEYLRIQYERANALLMENIREAVESLKERLARKWRDLKDRIPAVKKLAEGPAGVPLGIAFWMVVYALICFPLMRIATRLRANGLTAWIPVLQIFLLIRMSEKPLVIWFVFLLFPLVNLLAFVFLWMSIARRLGQTHMLGYLMLIPGVNILALWYLAMLPPEPSAPPQETFDTGIKFE